MQHQIPLFDLNYDETEEKALIATLRTGWISMGPKVMEFERMFAEMLGARYAVATSNCTMALHMALLLLEIREGDEVITPSLTFVATVNAIRYVNANPAFCDVRSLEDLTIDPEMIEELISKRTRAIMVMHYAGYPCDMDRIMALARKRELKVIEDSSHAPLSTYKGKKLGTFGDVGCFSFFSNKNLSTGEGGMLVTNNRSYYEKARLLRSHGMTAVSYDRATGHSTSYDVIELGYNFRMDDLRASLGIAQLHKLESDVSKRGLIYDSYIKHLCNVKGLILPFRHREDYASHYIFPVLLEHLKREKRELVRQALAKNGIQTSVHYPAVHRFSQYQRYHASLPLTEHISDSEITLPLYSKLTPAQVGYISRTLEEAIRNA